MQILINHLTRMKSGFICVAGINLTGGRHVRPVVRGAGLRTELLAQHGGPMAIGAIVELGPTRFVGKPPETEDWLFDPKQAVQVRTAQPEEFWRGLESVARAKFIDLFGPELQSQGAHSCGSAAGQGRVSLGCLRLTRRAELTLRARAGKPAQIRLHVQDGDFDLDLGVTDIRLYGPDHQTPDVQAVERYAHQLQGSGEIILSCGLSRPFAPAAESRPLHWLQINNLHFQVDPLGLGTS